MPTFASTNKASSGKATLVDIARESEVSPATVSLVLRDKPGVGDDTRRRVMDAAINLGYPMRSALESGKPDGIGSMGVVLKVQGDDLLAVNHFYSPVLAGIESVCRRDRINLLVASVPVDEHNVPLAWPRLLTEDATDGLLLLGERLDERVLAVLQQRAMPVVLVDAYAPGDPYDAVTIDNAAGAHQAVTHLIDNGHRYIAIVGSQRQGFPSIMERRRGYEQAMQEHGLAPRFVDCALDRNAVAGPLTAFLQANPETTALFACNDEVAIAAIRTAQAAGRSLPFDLSIVGFDNITLAQDIDPPLTTMRVDKIGMGRMAAQLLINRIMWPESGYTRLVSRPSLIGRASVRAISPST